MENIWIDCDPGIDDAVMLAAAAAHRDVLHIWGISTVAGNQSSDLVTENALRLASLLGMDDVPVARGAQEPLIRTKTDASHVHGENGIGNCVIPPAKHGESDKNAIELMRDTIMALPEGETMTLVPTAPLTNIALLFKVFPEVKHRIGRIVLMGGSASEGNATPFAEFNIFADPDAAQIVFAEHEIPVVMCGLDVTSQCILRKEKINKIAGKGSATQRAMAEMLQFYGTSSSYAPLNCVLMHDSCTIGYLLHPELFSGRQVTVNVVRQGENMGQTVCTPGGNVLLLDHADVETFEQMVLEDICNKSF